MSGLEAALEELYSVDPAEFTKTRDRLIKQLKATGDKEAAASIGARRKPTQIAWVLNQLARREPDAVSELVDVGKELAREQRKALRGEASTGLRDSIEKQRKTVTELAKKTGAMMKELGVDAGAHLEEVTRALQAALVDPVVGAQLEEGRFEKAPEAAVGFGGPIPDDEGSRPAPAKRKSAPPPKADERDEAAKKAAAEAEAARKAARAEHAKLVTAAKHELKEATAAAARTRKKADEAEAEAKALIELATRLAKEAHEKETAAKAAEKALSKLEANAPD